MSDDEVPEPPLRREYEYFKWECDADSTLWVRDIDEAEAYYTAQLRAYQGCGRSSCFITGYASLRVPVPEGVMRQTVEVDFLDALIKAWIALRYNHPTIASQVVLDPDLSLWRKEYEANDPRWFDKTWKQRSADRWPTGKDFVKDRPSETYYATMTCIIPETMDTLSTEAHRDIVLRAPPNIIDGMGALHLLNNYVKLAAKYYHKGRGSKPPDLSDEAVIKHLSPPLRVAADIPPSSQGSFEEHTDVLDLAEAAQPAKKIEPMTLPYIGGRLQPEDVDRVEINFPPDETATLIAACKTITPDESCTITHVFHAAVIMSLYILQSNTNEEKKVEYVTHIVRDERSRCLHAYNPSRHPATVYHSLAKERLVIQLNLPSLEEANSLQSPTSPPAESPAAADTPCTKKTSADEKEEFFQIIRKMTDYYNTVRNDENQHIVASDIFVKRMPPLTMNIREAMVSPPVPNPSRTPSVSLTSMGLIDDVVKPEHSPIQVHEAWVTNDELTNGYSLYIGTFRGELSLSAVYNTAWHSEDVAQEFLDHCGQIVWQHLGDD